MNIKEFRKEIEQRIKYLKNFLSKKEIQETLYYYQTKEDYNYGITRYRVGDELYNRLGMFNFETNKFVKYSKDNLKEFFKEDFVPQLFYIEDFMESKHGIKLPRYDYTLLFKVGDAFFYDDGKEYYPREESLSRRIISFMNDPLARIHNINREYFSPINSEGYKYKIYFGKTYRPMPSIVVELSELKFDGTEWHRADVSKYEINNLFKAFHIEDSEVQKWLLDINKYYDGVFMPAYRLKKPSEPGEQYSLLNQEKVKEVLDKIEWLEKSLVFVKESE